MNKKLIVAALGLCVLVATPAAFAQTSGNDNGKKELKADKRGGKRGAEAPNPFEGLNLTDAQKTQLQQLNTKRVEQRKQQAQARKADKQRNDSTRMEARKNARKEYLEEVKAIIGPDQYVVFLENMYVNGGGNHNGKAIQKGQRMGKHGMAHNRADKGNRRHDGKNRQAQRMNNAPAAANAQS